MIQKLLTRFKAQSGFTIVETMIVLAIVGLIMVIVFIAIPEEAASRRDSYRKAYAHQVVGALEDFYKNNGKFPGCAIGCSTADMQRFMTIYLPDGSDPSTGLAYHSTPVTVGSDGSVGDGKVIKSASGAAMYVDNEIHHNVKPKEGQIIIGTAHWCYSSTGKDPSDPSGKGPLAGAPQDPVTHDWDQDVSKFVVLIYQEKGGYYCLDNYTAS